MRIWCRHRFGPCRVGDGIHRHPGDRGIIGRRFASGMMAVADCGRRSITPVDSGMSLTTLLMGAAEGPNSSPSSPSVPADRPSSHSGFARCQSFLSQGNPCGPLFRPASPPPRRSRALPDRRTDRWNGPNQWNVSGGNEVEVGGGVGAGRSVRDRPRTGRRRIRAVVRARPKLAAAATSCRARGGIWAPAWVPIGRRGPGTGRSRRIANGCGRVWGSGFDAGNRGAPRSGRITYNPPYVN